MKTVLKMFFSFLSFLFCLLIFSGCTVPGGESATLPELQWEGRNYGSVADGVYSNGIFSWTLPDGGRGCKLLTDNPALQETEVILRNGPEGSEEKIIVTRNFFQTSEMPEKELLQKITEQELSALRAGYNDLKTTEITDFATENISGRYFGCRTDNVEMSIVFFRPAGTSDLCSYSYSRMLPRRNSSSWEVLRQKTESGAAKIKFHTLANSVFGSR